MRGKMEKRFQRPKMYHKTWRGNTYWYSYFTVQCKAELFQFSIKDTYFPTLQIQSFEFYFINNCGLFYNEDKTLQNCSKYQQMQSVERKKKSAAFCKNVNDLTVWIAFGWEVEGINAFQVNILTIVKSVHAAAQKWLQVIVPH